MEKQENWLPLESNPEVMNNLLGQLGVNIVKYGVQDLLSVEQWAQQMLGQPVLGIIFLYELNQKQKQYEKLQKQSKDPTNQDIFFMYQYARNACGTIALFHIIMNAIYDYPDLVFEGTQFSIFREQSFGKSPQEIGQEFKKSKRICQTHKQSVKKGETPVQSKVETHFIAFVQKGGFLYELDGRKKAPVNHGQCPEGLTSSACAVIQSYMARDPQNNKFTILALGQRPQF